MPLKAVAFDVDGTLYPNASMYLRSIVLVLKNLKLFRALEAARLHLRDHPDPSQDFHRAQALLVGQRLGVSADEAQARIERLVYTRWFGIFPHLRVFDGLKRAVESFRAAGLKLAVMSDFPIRGRLADLGLTGPWDTVFSSEETGYLKPHPQPFAQLAERLRLTPSDVLYVGNSYRYDVLGAHAAGMPSAHLTNKEPRPDSPAVLTFRRYAQLQEYVLREARDSGYNTGGRVPV